MKEIAQALVRAQRAFGPALKTRTNPHLKTKYADLGAVIEAVIDALHANGIALTQHTHDSQDGVTVETVFVHESGEQYTTGRLHVPAVKTDPQGYGSALTYARRYSLMAACGIAPEDDDGQAASRGKRDEHASIDAYAAKHLPALREAAQRGGDALAEAFKALPKSVEKAAFWQVHQAELKALASEVK
ncbi:MAG: hypothetical protein RIR00_1592 [Pseudomonadota bacterium]|jgi:hypothetical protein